MRKLLLAAIALLSLGTGVFAADLYPPAKAPFLSPYPTTGCGAYYGINALGSAGPVANAPISSNALGGAIGGTLGYTCQSSPSTFWFIEAMADIQNLNGSGGVGLSGPAHLEQRAAFGGPIANMLNVFPNLNVPAVPSLPSLGGGITAGPTNGYIYVAVNEDDISATFGNATARDWAITPEVGVGLLSRLSNNVVADVWAGVALQSNEFCMSAGGATVACPRMATGARAGFALKY